MDWSLMLIYGIVAVVILVALYNAVCLIQASRTPPDAWIETNRACGFPKQKR